MDHLKGSLESHLKNKNYIRDEKLVLNEEVTEFLKLYPKATQGVDDTYKKIPKFFKPVGFLIFSIFFKKK